MTHKETVRLVLEEYLCREMPAGTIIGDPKWWANKIAGVLTNPEPSKPTDTYDDTYDDPCPDCGKQLQVARGGGVKCSCGYWFCF